MRSHYQNGPDGHRRAGRRGREIHAAHFGSNFGQDGPFGPDGPFGRHGPFGPDGPYGRGGQFGRGGGGGGRRRRMFDGEELRLVLLKLVADQPRHGYELIKAIEEMTGNNYAPSPGIVYPSLTMLDDMGLIAEQQSREAKKVFEATDEGRAHLESRAEEVNALIARLDEVGSRQRRHARPEMARAIGNLMTALGNRAAREDWNDDQVNQVVDILDEAARKIERIG